MDAALGEAITVLRPSPRLPPVTIAIVVVVISAFVVDMIGSFSPLIYLKLIQTRPVRAAASAAPWQDQERASEQQSVSSAGFLGMKKLSSPLLAA